MATKKTLNAEGLEKLGARRLADLLLELAEKDAAIKRRLRLALAAQAAPGRLAAEVRKRLTQIGRATSYLERHKVRALAAELDLQRRTIAEQLANTDAAEALVLMWEFMDLANFVQERCDDSDGEIGDVFRVACRDLGPLAKAAKANPIALADRISAALASNDYGQYDDLIGTLAPSLGNEGLDRLKAHFIQLSNVPVETPPQDKRKVIGWSANGPLYEDQLKVSSRDGAIRLALQDIAEAQGDVDAFIAEFSEKTRKAPGIAAEIAERLLAVGRAEEALQALDNADRQRSAWPDFEWENARIKVLEVLGRDEEAQSSRWTCFADALSAEHLRAYLKRLPDFDDVEAEERALDHAEGQKHLLPALHFLVTWPALARAARLVIRRSKELDGRYYETLAPAADALAGKHPFAATLLLRAMIDFALTQARSSRYRHAARHFLECSSLAGAITDYGSFETHAAYAARLRAEHGRKIAFWQLAA